MTQRARGSMLERISRQINPAAWKAIDAGTAREGVIVQQLGIARRTMEAMAAATPRMLYVGAEGLRDAGAPDESAPTLARGCWSAMIEAALAEVD